MITAKFGGTCITPRNLHFVKSIVTRHHKAVVVSAIGKEHVADTKVTDLLTNYYNTGNEFFWQQVARKYQLLCVANGIEVDVQHLLNVAHSTALNKGLAHCLSLGEQLSAQIVAAYLGARYVEAQKVVRFSGGKVDFVTTYANVRSLLCDDAPFVMGGFYGGNNNGERVTFSRGGGDVSGAIVAAATDSSMYENWTDVCGVCAANPTVIMGAPTLAMLSYNQMRQLAQAGASVLHPDAVLPVEERAIPIRVANFANPNGKGTLISHCPNASLLLAITEKILPCSIFQTTMLFNCALSQILQHVSLFLQQYNGKQVAICGSVSEQKLQVTNVFCTQNSITLTSNLSIQRALYPIVTSQISAQG